MTHRSFVRSVFDLDDVLNILCAMLLVFTCVYGCYCSDLAVGIALLLASC